MDSINYKMLLEELKNSGQLINSSVGRNNYQEQLKKLKSVLDKEYILSYYDIRFNVLNENKLLETIKPLLKRKERQNLLFIQLKNLNSDYYSLKKKTIIENMQKLNSYLKTQLSSKTDFIVENEYYMFGDFLVFIINNNKIRKFYKIIKSIFASVDYFEWRIYFEELEKNGSKALKSFEKCYLKVLEKVKSNLTFENEINDTKTNAWHLDNTRKE